MFAFSRFKSLSLDSLKVISSYVFINRVFISLMRVRSARYSMYFFCRLGKPFFNQNSFDDVLYILNRRNLNIWVFMQLLHNFLCQSHGFLIVFLSCSYSCLVDGISYLLNVEGYFLPSLFKIFVIIFRPLFYVILNKYNN